MFHNVFRRIPGVSQRFNGVQSLLRCFQPNRRGSPQKSFEEGRRAPREVLIEDALYDLKRPTERAKARARGEEKPMLERFLRRLIFEDVDAPGLNRLRNPGSPWFRTVFCARLVF